MISNEISSTEQALEQPVQSTETPSTTESQATEQVAAEALQLQGASKKEPEVFAVVSSTSEQPVQSTETQSKGETDGTACASSVTLTSDKELLAESTKNTGDSSSNNVIIKTEGDENVMQSSKVADTINTSM